MDWDLLITVTFVQKKLFKVGLHKSDDGKVILTNSFIYVLNRFVSWNKVRMISLSKNDSLL